MENQKLFKPYWKIELRLLIYKDTSKYFLNSSPLMFYLRIQRSRHDCQFGKAQPFYITYMLDEMFGLYFIHY